MESVNISIKQTKKMKVKKETFCVIRLGNCSTGNSEGGACYSTLGISQTITAGTHGYGMGNIVCITTN